jgi:hypothetical protein
MKATFRFAIALFIVAGLSSGCGKKTSTPLSPVGASSSGGSSGTPANDQAEASSAMAAAPELIEDGVFESPDQGTLPSGPGGFAAIRPLMYWRNITSVDRSFEFAFADTDTTGRPTTAIVTFHKLLKGTFNIATGPRPEVAASDSMRLLIVRKPLADHWVRRVLLKRVRGDGDNDDRNRRWRIAASSGVEVTSRSATTKILSLKIATADRETTVTDPLAFFRLRQFMAFDAGDSVRLTVTTGRNYDVVVLMSRGLRAMFHNNGDNTYTGVWRSPFWRGVNHLGVNAFSHGTLFDDTLPYDSQAWILPFVVRPTMLANFIP